jgi:hypothetical protein
MTAITVPMAAGTAVSTNGRTPSLPDLGSYDYIIVASSGGKDSIACTLHLLERGVDMAKVEIWHHLVDGQGPVHFDWPCTESYVWAFANALGIPCYFSWRIGGLMGELLRENRLTNPVQFEAPGGQLFTAGGMRGKPNTRRRWPALGTNLATRWCSYCVKIDVGSLALTNQARFRGARTLFITGERAEESANRARYAHFEPHRSDLRNGRNYQRHVDHWRPVHGWPEADVWAIMKRHNINPHPAYRLGWSRCSCRNCIFNSNDHWASLWAIKPDIILAIDQLERELDFTMHPTMSILERVERGRPFAMKQADIDAAMSPIWQQPIILEPGTWQLPAGAFRGGTCGPT